MIGMQFASTTDHIATPEQAPAQHRMVVQDRRRAIRLSVLAAFAATFGRFDFLAIPAEATGNGAARGLITADLGQWKWLVFDYKGKRIALPTEEVFAALEEAYGSAPIPGPGTGRK